MKRVINCIFGSFVFLLFFTGHSFSQDVHSETDIPKAISIEIEDISPVLEKLNSAKTIVINNEARKKRDIIFHKPVKVFDLSDKYAVVSYIAESQHKERSVVGFLIVKNHDDIIVPPSVPHLIWRGEADINAFNNITEDVLAKYFREMGIKDVYPIYSQMKLREKIDSKAELNHSHSGEDISSGIISEMFIDDSITRDAELKEALKKKADMAFVLGLSSKKDSPKVGSVNINTVDSLRQRVAELEKKVIQLQALLVGVVRTNNDIYFKNVNIHLVNGTGKTESANSSGNFFIGYNEDGSVTGSHNLVIGQKNNASGYGNIVSGKNNLTQENYSASIGGVNNKASGKFSSVIGGQNNTASGAYSVIAGGEDNQAKGDLSIIAGGKKRKVVNSNPHFTQ